MSEDHELRQAMYRFASLVVLADDEMSELERSWLDRLVVALGFDDTLRQSLEIEALA